MGAKNTWTGAILALVLCVPAQPAKQHARRMVRPEPRMEFKADDVNNASLTPTLGPAAHGSAVVRAQILLDRQHFSSGEIDGHFGSNLVKAVSAFQTAHDLRPTGTVDAPTWAALNSDTAPALVPYEITAEDVAGPFVKVPADMMQQSTLPALGYQSAQEGLGERFHASPKLLEALNPGSNSTSRVSKSWRPSVNRAALGQAASVVVTKSESSVAALDKEGRVLAWYAATIGSEHDPLP